MAPAESSRNIGSLRSCARVRTGGSGPSSIKPSTWKASASAALGMMASRLFATVVQPIKSGNDAPNTPFASWISATTCIFRLQRTSPVPSRLPIDGAQRAGWNLPGAVIQGDASRLRRMAILDVIARAFADHSPAVPASRAATSRVLLEWSRRDYQRTSVYIYTLSPRSVNPVCVSISIASADCAVGVSAQAGDDLAVGGLRECLERARAHVAEHAELHEEACHHRVVGRLGDRDQIVITHGQVDLLDLAAHVAQQFFRRVETFGRILDLLRALVGPVAQRDVGGHGRTSLILARTAASRRLVYRFVTPGSPGRAVEIGLQCGDERPQPGATPWTQRPRPSPIRSPRTTSFRPTWNGTRRAFPAAPPRRCSSTRRPACSRRSSRWSPAPCCRTMSTC